MNGGRPPVAPTNRTDLRSWAHLRAGFLRSSARPPPLAFDRRGDRRSPVHVNPRPICPEIWSHRRRCARRSRVVGFLALKPRATAGRPYAVPRVAFARFPCFRRMNGGRPPVAPTRCHALRYWVYFRACFRPSPVRPPPPDIPERLVPRRGATRCVRPFAMFPAHKPRATAGRPYD
jgi:hypothetical protein